MAINYPTSLDAFTNPTATDQLDSATVPHDAQHANVNDAIEALEAKVGITNSAVTTSHEYKINNTLAPKDSPVFSGNVTGLGAATGTSFNSITALASATSPMDGTAAIGTSTTVARQDHVHPSDTSRAAVAQTFYLGTTAIAINRSSAAAHAITGITLDTGVLTTGTLPVARGGTGTATAPVQGGIIFGSTTSAYGSTAAGTSGQLLTSAGTGTPTWSGLDLSIHGPDLSYKKTCRLATTVDLGASTFATDILTGYDDLPTALALTTTAASTTITTTSTASIKVGAVTSVATVQVAAGTTIATIASATSFTVTNRANITTTAITGNSTTATATFAAQTYAPYAVGATILISGATPTTYNGSFVVTACTTTTVSWASVETVTATVQGTIAFTIAAGTSISTSFKNTIAALSIDGVATVLNDRILVKDQRTLGGLIDATAAKYNGIYTVTAIGSTTVPWTLTRAADANAATDLDGAIVNISVGTANYGKSYKTRFSGTNTLNTTEMYWSRLIDVNSSSLAITPTTAIGVDITTDTETVMYKAGAVTDFAVNSIGVKTLQATSASTYTRASSLYIAGAPVASTNVTTTTPYSLYVAGGNSYLGAAVTATSFNSITALASATSPMDGTAAVGTSTTVARQDHVHPSDTTKASTSAPTLTGVKETKVAMAANDINLTSGNMFTKTISGATTLTVSNIATTGSVNSFILELTNGGSAVITWWSGVKWAAGIAPVLTTAGVDILGFYTHDGGTTWRGTILARDSK